MYLYIVNSLYYNYICMYLNYLIHLMNIHIMYVYLKALSAKDKLTSFSVFNITKSRFVVNFPVIPGQTGKEKTPAADLSQDGPDVVSTLIGKYGRWQLLMTFLLSLFSLPCTFHIYLPTFTVSVINTT